MSSTYAKEPYVYPQKKPCIYPQKSPTNTRKRALCVPAKKALHYPQKSPTYTRKKALYISGFVDIQICSTFWVGSTFVQKLSPAKIVVSVASFTTMSQVTRVTDDVTHNMSTLIDKIPGLFCRISSLLEGSFTKEIYNFKEPTNEWCHTQHEHSDEHALRHTPLRIVSHVIRVMYGVASISRLLKIIGLFCRISSLL